jgi:hypothetical protein
MDGSNGRLSSELVFPGPGGVFPSRTRVFPSGQGGSRPGPSGGASQGQSNCLPAGYWHNQIGVTRQAGNAANSISDKIAGRRTLAN